MAALSRPSLRSSARRKTSLDHVPPTDIPQNPLPSSRRGKRTRESSPDGQSNASAKKQKSDPQQSTHPKAAPKSQVAKSLPIRDKPPTHDTLTQVGASQKPDQVQQLANGSTSTSHNDQPSSQGNNSANRTSPILSKVDKRSLRSHDGGSRSKSELAMYFHNYDELVSIEPKEPDFITPETLIHITDEPSKSTTSSAPSSPSIKNTSKKLGPSSSSHHATVNGFSKAFELPEETFTTLHDATRIDLFSIDKRTRQDMKDPLNDAFYLKSHRRAERQEKQLRNIEKERAMHEKVQLERLLDGLKGHDWLRVMGISGITDGEKKAFEPKRDHFIREVQTLLTKFREWKEEEKRRKVEKEETIADEDEDQEGEEDLEKEAEAESDGEPPRYTGVDASAARQLHREAILATNKAQVAKNRSHRAAPVIAPPVEKPFTSFYSKPYLRDAAIGKHRRGRARFAFGQPVPEPYEQPFTLPEDMLTPDAIAASARSRRRARRQSKEA